MIDETWLAIGVAAIVLPAIAYAEHLHSYVCRKMFGDENLDVLDELADEDVAKNAAKSLPNLRRGAP